MNRYIIYFLNVLFFFCGCSEKKGEEISLVNKNSKNDLHLIYDTSFRNVLTYFVELDNKTSKFIDIDTTLIYLDSISYLTREKNKNGFETIRQFNIPKNEVFVEEYYDRKSLNTKGRYLIQVIYPKIRLYNDLAEETDTMMVEKYYICLKDGSWKTYKNDSLFINEIWEKGRIRYRITGEFN